MAGALPRSTLVIPTTNGPGRAPMTPAEEMAMLFAGREAAYAAMFRFMRIALQQTLQTAEQSQATPQSGGHAPPGPALRQQYQDFRSAHLAPPPGLAMPADPASAEKLRQAYARAYRAQFDKLHKELTAASPWLAPLDGRV